MLVVPDLMLGIFLHNPETLDVARARPMRLIGATMVGRGDRHCAYACTTGRRRRSPGHAHIYLLPVVSTFLPLAYLFGPILGYGLLGVWLLNISYRVLVAGVFSLLWHREKWASIKV